MSLNHVFNEDLAKRDKLQSQFYSTKLQTTLEFNDPEFQQNGIIQTDLNRAGRNDLYFTNEQAIQFPVNESFQRFYTQLSPDVIINYDDGEKSIFDTTNSIGGLEILPNITRVGSIYRATAHGRISVSGGNQQIRLKTKLGNSIIEEQSYSLPNLQADSLWKLELELTVYQIGNTGTASIKTFGTMSFTQQNGSTNTFFIDDDNDTTYQTTQLALADITLEWLSVTSGNTLSVHTASVYMLN